MNQFASIFFIVLAVNLIAFAFGFLSPELFLLGFFAIPIEFFTGLLMVFFKRHRSTGAAMLAASSVTILVAGFVCSNYSVAVR